MEINKKQKINKILLSVVLVIICFVGGYVVGTIARERISKNTSNNQNVQSSEYKIVYEDGYTPGSKYDIEIDKNYNMDVILQPYCSTLECMKGEYYPEKQKYSVNLTKEQKDIFEKIVKKIFKGNKTNTITVFGEFKMLTEEENSFFKTIIMKKESNNAFKCNYEKLKNAEELTETEKHNMITEEFLSVEYIIDPLNFEIKNIDEYRYSLKFGVQDGEGQELYTILWKENKKWHNSEYFKSMEELKQNSDLICKTIFSEDWINNLLNKYKIHDITYSYTVGTNNPDVVEKKLNPSKNRAFLIEAFDILDKKENKSKLLEGIGFEHSSSIEIIYEDYDNKEHMLSIIDMNSTKNEVAVIDYERIYENNGKKQEKLIRSDVYKLNQNNLFIDVVEKYFK